MNAQPHTADREICVIHADHTINDDATEALIQSLQSEIEAGRHRKIIVDCSQLDFLSSFGLSMLLRLRNAVKLAGGEIRLSGLSPLIGQLLELSKVNHLFSTCADVEQARSSFGKPT